MICFPVTSSGWRPVVYVKPDGSCVVVTTSGKESYTVAAYAVTIKEESEK